MRAFPPISLRPKGCVLSRKEAGEATGNLTSPVGPGHWNFLRDPQVMLR